MNPPRRLIGRLSGLPILIGVLAVTALGGALALEFRPGAPPPRHVVGLVVALACCAWALVDMLFYAANILFAGGCGLYERGGKIIYRFPFLTALRLEDVTGVGVGTNFVFKDAPDYIYLAVKGGRQVNVPTFLHKTPFQEMIATLEALGVPRIPGKGGAPEALP